MMGLRFLTYSMCVAAASIVFGGCRRVPDGVIPPEDMAVLMADTYMGEGVVDMNNSVFRMTRQEWCSNRASTPRMV